jgi:beta-lysine N6-acetyltransferase
VFSSHFDSLAPIEEILEDRMLKAKSRPMEPDCVEEIPGATIQHGQMNDRVYLMKLKIEEKTPVERVLTDVERIAQNHDYGKIFAKSPASTLEHFVEQGFELEAQVPGYYQGEQGREDAYFLGKYLNAERSVITNSAHLEQVIAVSTSKPCISSHDLELPQGLSLRELNTDDTQAMAEIYRQIFPTYPFPIDDPSYLTEVMQDFVRSFGVENEHGQLVALAACEMDKANGSVEMTDFATLPAYRGSSLALNLLDTMESAMEASGLQTAYTIARAESFGMNATFAKGGYEFQGTLKNNTNISGAIESMNVWSKDLNEGR